MALINPFPDAPWFSIDEDQYLMYLLKGYEIHLSDKKQRVYFSLDGKWHRVNGPAVIWKDGTVSYWQNGNLHREDGPAVIYEDGYVQYFQNGKRHREDGPAVIWGDRIEYWLDYRQYSKKDYNKALENGTY